MQYTFLSTPWTEKRGVFSRDLEFIEQKIGAPLPEVLKEYYWKHNGREIQYCEYLLDGDELDVSEMLPLNDASVSVLSMYEANGMHEDLSKTLVPFATDSCSGFYYWDAATDKIYLSYHEGADDFRFICSGMDNFMEMMNLACNMQDGNMYDFTEISRRDAAMAKVDFLPLGSVVILTGGVQKLMIVGRGLNVTNGEETYFFDYAGVIFPQGLNGDQVAYFNHDGVNRIIAYGYMDEDSAIVDENLNAYLEANPNVKRANPQEWKA